MLYEHEGKHPQIHETAFIAPNATVCGDVTIGANCRILWGAVIVAESGPVVIGSQCIIMENAVIRGVKHHPVTIGDHVLIGPHAALNGCIVEDNVFIATGAAIFNGVTLGARSEVRINGVVHVASTLLPDTTVPIGWIAVGDPAQLFPPDQHDAIWQVQRSMDFPGKVFGMPRASEGESIMPEMTGRYANALGRFRAIRPADGE